MRCTCHHKADADTPAGMHLVLGLEIGGGHDNDT